MWEWTVFKRNFHSSLSFRNSSSDKQPPSGQQSDGDDKKNDKIMWLVIGYLLISGEEMLGI